MTMATFCGLIKTSAGYISVLHTTKDENRTIQDSILCSLLLKVQYHSIIPIIDMIAEDWIKSKNIQERNIMIRRAQIARNIVTCAYCVMAVGCLFVIVPPGFGMPIRLTSNITDPGKIVPLQSYYIYDVTKRPQYELTYISQSIYVVLAVITYTGIDHFLGLLIFHISGQFDILKNHGNDLSLTHLVFFMSTFFNLFGHMCLYCALGEFLVAQCNKIYYAAYINKWYKMNPKVTQDLLILMIRGSKPVYLTAGKVFPVTMATFCSVSYQYLTVIIILKFIWYIIYFLKYILHKVFIIFYNIKLESFVDFEWAVKLNRFTLDLLGLWPKNIQNPWQKLMCNFRVLVVSLGLTVCLVIPSIHSLIRIFGDVLLMLDNLQFTLPIISCVIRIMIFWWKKEAIIPIMNMIAKDWIMLKSNKERNMMIRRAQYARIIIICSYSIMALACFFIALLPIFGMSVRLTSNITDPGRIPMPLQTHYIYDITKRPQHELTFIGQVIYVTIAMMAYTGVDNFLSLVIFHICGQLDILENRMQYLDKYINYHKILKCCLTKHIRLLRAIDMIEDTYNGILLSLFIYFAILFAFYGFRVISVSIISKNE
ncbi:hypothetical protein ALC62_03125 [Cyphomyrmex costatus]|uniref:Odorant receptor 13a n=1 Tax=Cyphomyrmex costatus TaxID=456900 RepID=A0A151IM32_9HYME|nr:hypothetical protein ALC62_03125 [Cyphomyrmex costatus]